MILKGSARANGLPPRRLDGVGLGHCVGRVVRRPASALGRLPGSAAAAQAGAVGARTPCRPHRHREGASRGVLTGWGSPCRRDERHP